MKAPKGDLVPTDTCERERVLEQLRRSISQSADSSDSLAVASSNGTTVPNEPAASSQAGDSIAWRQWLSFDDALGRSAAVSELRRIAQPQGLNLAEALAALDADALPGLPATSPFTQSLLTPYREAQRLLAKRSGNDQPTIVTSPAAAANRARESSSSSKADTALSLANLTETRENDAAATPTSPAPAVAIAAPEDLFGHTFDVVIFGGFVNGFIPSRDMCDPGVIVGGARVRQEATDRDTIALAEQRATRRLLFTSFESCDLETAERLRLHIPRIRLRNGVRTCDIEPSSYLQELNLGPKQISGPTDQRHPSA